MDISTRSSVYPRSIHRKEYFTKTVPKSRRIIEPYKLRDTEYKLDRDVPKGNHGDYIKEKLDTFFKNRLDSELMGEAE